MAVNQDGMDKAGWTVWTGRILSGLVVAFLVLLDGVMKLIPATPVMETSAQMGWPTEVLGLRMYLRSKELRDLFPLRRTPGGYR